MTGPNYHPSIDSPAPKFALPALQRPGSSAYNPSGMGVGEAYSPPSERNRSTSVPTSASPGHSVMASPVVGQLSSPNSDTSARARVSVRRTQEPPRNEQGEIYCNHEECLRNPQPPTFRRVCEWNKHMDKHDRPYVCKEQGCEKIQGFTYSGGLLRHQREVHKKNASARKPLFCPFQNCNRHSGTGFTRRENLNEHIRRRHVHEANTDTPAAPVTASPAAVPVSASRPPSTPLQAFDAPRKRKRTTTLDSEYASDIPDEGDFEDSGMTDLQGTMALVKRLRTELQNKDRLVSELTGRIQQQELVIQQLLHQHSVNTRGLT